jgi:hypothetical protein
MIELFAAASKALASLVGPVAAYAYKRSGQAFFDPLLQEFANPTEEAHQRAASLARQLSEKGLTQRQLIDLAAFCSSEEGAHCFRLVAINALAGNALKKEIVSALTTQVAAMIRLHTRQSDFPHADVAAQVLVGQSASEIIRSATKLKKRDRDLAMELQNLAIEQSQLPDLLKAQQLRTRASHIASLSEVLPTTVVSELDDYCALLKDEYSQLTIATGAGGSITVPIQENLIDSTVSYRDGGQFTSSMHATGSILPALLARHRHVVLLGDPGGGKSTAVRGAVHDFAMAYELGDPVPIPFVVTLRLFARVLRTEVNVGFIAYIAENLLSDHDQALGVATFRYLLHTGRAVVFFDGLDEIIDIDSRRQVIEKIEKFSRRFVSAALVVTSREIGYDHAPVRGTFKHLVLEPFDQDQTEQFASNVFTAVPRKDGIAADALLGEFMTDSLAVRDLRSNPLLLGVLCLLYASSHRIPRNRLQLYRRCAAMLFEVWDGERGIFVPLIDADAAEQAVRDVALRIFESGEEEIAKTDVEDALIDFYRATSNALPYFRAHAFAADALKAWAGRKWILSFAGERDGESYYRFSHRTFLEYFAAEQVVYESQSAVEAWERIRHYAESSVATPFCELVLQMMSTKTKGAADRMIAEAASNLMPDEEERLPAALAVMQLLSGAIATLRIQSDTRDLVLWTGLDLLSRLVPWDTVANLRGVGEPPFLGYRSVFTTRGGDPDADDAYQDVNVDEASALLKGFMHLDSDERRRLLETAKLNFHDLPIVGATRWLRLAYALRAVPYFEGWRHVHNEWREELAGFAEEVWLLAAEAGVAGELALPEEVDYWLVGALLRDEAIANAVAIEALGWRGLFIGGWPFPVLDIPNVGTPAHTLALAAVGLERRESAGKWTDPQVDELCSALLGLQRDDEETLQQIIATDAEQARGKASAQVFQRAELGDSLSRRASSSTLSEARIQVGILLLRVMEDLGDHDFVMRVMEFASVAKRESKDGLFARLDAAGLGDDDWRLAEEPQGFGDAEASPVGPDDSTL